MAGQSNVVLIIQIGLYLCSLILSLTIVVPMSMHQDQFKGHCLLFSTGEWRSEDGQFLVDWASQAYCNFIIFVAVIMFVISVYQAVRLSKFALRGKDSSFFSAFVDVVLGAFMSAMTLTAAVFVTAGFKVWCDQITRRFEKCSDATGNDIDRTDSIDSSGYFIQMFTAQFGVWMSFSAWFGLFVFSAVKLCRYHFQENLRVSMAKERKRLINEDVVSEVPSHRHHHQKRGGGNNDPAKNSVVVTTAAEVITAVSEEDNEAEGGRFQEVVVEEEQDDDSDRDSSIRGNQIRIDDEDTPDLLR